MKVRAYLKALMIVPVLLASVLLAPIAIPRANALTGLVCITDSSTATGCPSDAPTLGPFTVDQTFTVGVFVQGSDAMGGFDIYVASDNAFVHPISAALGTLIASPSLTSICVNGSAQTGSCTPNTANGPGAVEVNTIESSGSNECGGISPCSGMAFTITYQVVDSTSSTPIFFPSAPGCDSGQSSVGGPTSDVCVTLDDAFGTTLPENIQGATVTRATPSITTSICGNQVDLSTGTLGRGFADNVSTSEGPTGWQYVSGPFTGFPFPAVSVAPYPQSSPSWATSPYVATTGGPPGRINWISYQNPLDTHSPAASNFTDSYTYQITFNALSGGTFYLNAFSADNAVQLQLQGYTWNSPGWVILNKGASDFKTWWTPATAGPGPVSISLLPSTSPYTLTARVINDGTVTGLAVDAVLCLNVTPSIMDLSTGTLGRGFADNVSTSEGPTGWQYVSGPAANPPFAAVSVAPFPQQPSPVWATSPYVATTGGPPGRINWISYQNPLDTHSPPGGNFATPNPYQYRITFTVSPQGGTFYLNAFSADNAVQLQLGGNTWNSPGWAANDPGASDFTTWWTPATAVPPGPASVNLPGGTYTLTGTVLNGGGVTGLAVDAVFAPASTATVDGSVSDQATLTGGYPSTGVTGTVTYEFFTNDNCISPGTVVNTVPVGPGNTVPSSSPVTPPSAGSFSFSATYSGDAHNRGVTSLCETLEVTDFTMAPSTNSLTVPPGSCATKTITITSINGFTGMISISTMVSSSLTASVSPSTVTLGPGGSALVTKKVCASVTTPPGSYTETITATSSSGLTHTITETDTVPAITTTPCFFFTLNGTAVSQKYCNPRANDLKVDFGRLPGAACFIQFTLNGSPNGKPLPCPAGANDFEVFWRITHTAPAIFRCTWTFNEKPLSSPCPVPQGSNDFRFFAAGGIVQVFWTINGALIMPGITPPSTGANDVEFFFIPPQPTTACFSFTLNGTAVSQDYCNPRANDLKVDFRRLPGAACFIQFTFLGLPNGNPVPCPARANNIEISWGAFPTGPVITACTWTFNEKPLSSPCPVPQGSNDFRFFAAGGIVQVFWTINGALIMPGITPPSTGANDVEFFFK